MMRPPVLDRRDREAIMAQVTAHAREYTPEWRCEGAEDDPGSALAALFGDMFYQTVDRMNSVPRKLYTEFLNLIGFQMPDPLPASGVLRFTAHETVEAPVPVPAGTQVFTRDEDGGNVVYETERRIESTAAQITGIFYVDPRAEVVERLDADRTNPYFTTAGGENLQRHRFSLSQNDVLALAGPCTVEVRLCQQPDFITTEIAARLAAPDSTRWTFHSKAGETPFDGVRVENSTIFLDYRGSEAFLPDGEGRYTVSCSGSFGSGTITLEGVCLLSRPAGRLALDSVANGDTVLDLAEGGYCLGRRPAPYSLCYFRSDRAFCKHGARVNLRLDVAPVITELASTAPQYAFNQRIIDKRDAVAIVPDDVYVAQVVWEYFNGLGWRPLAVSGSRNPFSCRQEGPLELTFDVPDDLLKTEVNAEEGYYIRARVVHVENQFSMQPRWIVPFLRGADCTWAYDQGKPVDWCRAENNGGQVTLEDAAAVGQLHFTAAEGLEEHPRAMYFCFDRSPHAVPLSIFFDVAGRVRLEDKLSFEAWTGSRFELVRSVDLSRNLLHPGAMLLYLPEPLPRRTLFGVSGCWLRLCRSSYLENRAGYPMIKAIHLNAVSAVQRERAEDEIFSTGAYEAGKQLELLRRPVLNAQVWVDETSGLTVADAERLKDSLPGRVRLEWEDHVLSHCWVRWERTAELALCGPDERCYTLDPYTGVVAFGNGIHGRVPPEGRDNLRVSYYFGGGERGNRAAGTVTEPIGALPRISRVTNLTAMSGGTDRFSTEKAESVGARHLRHRERAAGTRDFEDIVVREFPQVLHVKCFPDQDGSGTYAPGHVSVVVEGRDLDNPQATDELCLRIQAELEHRCDCVMAAEGRLHVVSSTVITVGSCITVELEDMDQGAATQRELARRLEELINHRWREQDIGSQLCVNQVWQTVRETPNVRLVGSIRLEGQYEQAGLPRVVALEDNTGFPYATVKSGVHVIQIE